MSGHRHELTGETVGFAERAGIRRARTHAHVHRGAKVDDFDIARRGDEDVLRLHIAVHDACAAGRAAGVMLCEVQLRTAAHSARSTSARGCSCHTGPSSLFPCKCTDPSLTA